MRTLNLLVLRCRDLEKAKSFYECFGMSFQRHAHGSGPEHYAAEDDRGVFELYPLSSDATSADNGGLGFAQPDLVAVSAKLVSRGVAPQPITDKPWGKTFVVRDPDGRRVEVKEVK